MLARFRLPVARLLHAASSDVATLATPEGRKKAFCGTKVGMCRVGVERRCLFSSYATPSAVISLSKAHYSETTALALRIGTPAGQKVLLGSSGASFSTHTDKLRLSSQQLCRAFYIFTRVLFAVWLWGAGGWWRGGA